MLKGKNCVAILEQAGHFQTSPAHHNGVRVANSGRFCCFAGGARRGNCVFKEGSLLTEGKVKLWLWIDIFWIRKKKYSKVKAKVTLYYV